VPASVSRQPVAPVEPRLSEALARSGLRVTKHRASVIAVLSAERRPLTADEVAQVSRLPLSTTYRLLNDLVDAGITVRVPGPTRTDRFELSEQFTDRHHHHLVCHRCGSVADFDPSPALERAIHVELDSISTGFRADHHIFDVHGMCADCAASHS
jgi:Fur family transcriptional regulator, ferric uptake regulator